MTDSIEFTSAATALEQVRDLGRRGEFFRQADLAGAAVASFPQEWALQHAHVLAIANAGGLTHAKELYRDYCLGDIASVDARTLKARLLKDTALAAAPEQRQRLLQEAARAYEAAIEGAANAYYPQDNAAQLYYLAGDREQALHHAGRVLTDLAGLEATGADARWQLASRLNAHVIRGEFDKAQALSGDLVSAFARDWAGAATTIEHLSRLLAHKNVDETWLDALRPPEIAVFAGHIIAPPGETGRFPADLEENIAEKIAAQISQKNIGHAYGSLAAGADILFAEAFLARGINLTAVLPCDEEDFLRVSVAPSGDQWTRRYEAIRDHELVDVIMATDQPLLDDDNLFAYCSRLAMGLSVLRANYLKTSAEQFALWDGEAPQGTAGTAADISLWHDKMATGIRRRQTIIPVQAGGNIAPFPLQAAAAGDQPQDRRVARAILFGDFAGFSKLRDSQIPAFTRHVMGAAAEIMASSDADIMFRNTWGDGLYVVTKRASGAAELATRLQTKLASLPYADYGLPTSLKFRLGGHLGPVFQQQDPVLGQINFVGSQVSHAARIEPVAPPGATYISSPFAAALAFDTPGEFQCDLVGTTNLAKKYGATRIFSLRNS